MKRALLSLALAGCIHMAPGARMASAPLSPAECQKLDHRVLALHLTAIIASAGSSGGATGAGIFDGLPRYILAGSAAGFGLLGAITAYLSTYYAAQYSKGGCP